MSLFSSAPGDTLNEPLSFSIKVGGSTLANDLQVYSIDVVKNVNKLSRATIKIIGGDPKGHSFEESEETIFAPGSAISISTGYAEDNEVIFLGIIQKLSLSIGEGYQVDPARSLMVLECVDKAVKLINTYTNDVYEGKSDSQIFSTLISKVSGLKKTIKTTTITHDYLPKYNINDWDFIVERAQSNGMILLNSDNAIKIQDPKGTSTSSVLTITNGKALISFEAELNSGSQLNTLELTSYDPYSEKPIKGASSEPSLGTHGNLNGKTISTDTGPTKNAIFLSQNIDNKEAKATADALLIKSRMSRLVGTAKVKGVTGVDLGDLVTLDGFGTRFDGKAFVTNIGHHIRNGDYRTTIGFGIPRELFTPQKAIDISRLASPIEGLHIAKVVQLDKDPKNEFRILIDIPTLNATGKGIWAKFSHFYTTSKGGSFFLPEIGSQVIVSFLSNDARFPVVIGGLYTKKTQPYIKKIEKTNDLKAIVSKEDLTLEFDDKDKIVTLMTSKNNGISIAEKDAKSWRGKSLKKGLRIEDANGNLILTSSEGIKLISKKDILIQSKAKVTITGDKGIIAKAKSGTVSLDGKSIGLKSKTKITAKGSKGVDVNSGGMVNVKGKTINLN